MRKVGLIFGMMLIYTLISSKGRVDEKPVGLVSSLGELKESVVKLDSIIKDGKIH